MNDSPAQKPQLFEQEKKDIVVMLSVTMPANRPLDWWNVPRPVPLTDKRDQSGQASCLNRTILCFKNIGCSQIQDFLGFFLEADFCYRPQIIRSVLSLSSFNEISIRKLFFP